MSDDDDDEPMLSASSLAALQQFLSEEKERDDKLQHIMQSDSGPQNPQFNENWQLSQFWYSDATAEKLADEVVRAAGPQGRIALVSCPTLYAPVKRKCTNSVTLFEYDERFAAYGSNFCFYDYKNPLQVPAEMAGSFDVVVADPPFLSEECLTKTAVTIRFLSKHKVLLCTGATMADLAERLLQVKQLNFIPQHKNNLGNEFRCFCNYPCDL